MRKINKKITVKHWLIVAAVGFGIIISLSFIFLQEPDIKPLTKQEKIEVTNKKLAVSGEEFRVWGLNYLGEKGKLMEDDWNTNAGWAEIQEDFSEMKALGANSVRIHLQYEAFMVSAHEPNPQALQNLEHLVKAAEENGLYLMITGLGAYRKQDAPQWYDSLDEQARWATQAVFWENIAKTVAKSPAVLSYDLMNEPVVAVKPQEGWLPGEGLGGFHFVQNISLNKKDRTTTQVLKAWINQMSEAIRKEDDKTPITVGFLPFGSLANLSNELDIMSVHVYPKKAEIKASAQLIQDFQTNKPLIVSETYPLYSGADELKAFIEGNNQFVNGWMGHHFGRTPDELSSSKDISDATEKEWLNLFRSLSSQQTY